MLMKKGTIRLQYRKIIDVHATQLWERHVFDSSYAEFLMQAPLYNLDKKYTRFDELVAHVPGSEKLHFLVSASVVGFLKQLKGKVPDVLNNVGQFFLLFKSYKFELIQSSILDKAQHKVAVNFLTEPLTWYDTIGEQLLVGVDEATGAEEEVLTTVFSLQPFLTIYSFKESKQL